MADKGGLLTRTAAAFGRVFLRRELVGVDNFGNKYYKYMFKVLLILPSLRLHNLMPVPVRMVSIIAEFAGSLKRMFSRSQ